MRSNIEGQGHAVIKRSRSYVAGEVCSVRGQHFDRTARVNSCTFNLITPVFDVQLFVGDASFERFTAFIDGVSITTAAHAQLNQP